MENNLVRFFGKKRESTDRGHLLLRQQQANRGKAEEEQDMKLNAKRSIV
jgi:hypothetical protein